MRCLTPILVKVPYKDKNGLPLYGSIKVPCGRCYSCIMTKRAELTGRLMAENETATISMFLTLSYAEEYLYYNKNDVASVNKEHVQLFLKRYRKELAKHDITLRYFCVAEYGDSYNRPHYHLLCFYRFKPHVVNKNNIYVHRAKLEDYVYLSWRYGICDFGDVEQASCHYCSKYMYKESPNVPKGADKMFFLYSKRPGLGFDYITKQFKERMCRIRDGDGNYCNFFVNGIKFPLSRFFKRKLFDDEKYKLNEESFIKLKKKSYEEAQKDYNTKFANYRKKYNDNDEFRFSMHYIQDISNELIKQLKYKQKLKHNLK